MENIELTYEQLKQMDSSNYVLVDIRDESAVNYGMLPKAVHIPQEQLVEKN